MKTINLVLLAAMVMLGSCASYQATQLTALDPTFVRECQEIEGVSIGCKEYTEEDCLTYLDRNVIKKGFQPIQLTFYNESEKTYIFSTTSVGLPCAHPQDVAKVVQTSTLGRILGYGVGSLVFTPLIVPAVVDGIKSYKSNEKLDEDFSDKAKSRFTIEPRSFNKTLLFIPVQWFCPVFDLTLIEENTQTLKTVKIHAQR